MNTLLLKNKLVDSHCHFNLLSKSAENIFEKKKIIVEHIEQAILHNVKIIQNICVNLEEFEEINNLIFLGEDSILSIIKNKRISEFMEINDESLFSNFKIYTSIGVHPLYDEHKMDYEKIINICKNKYVNSIGECGLDYSELPSVELRRNQQMKFLMQIDIAHKLNLPLIIHTRAAEGQTYQYLKDSYNKRNIKGVMHCFTGSKELALKMLDIGFYISFSGIITFKKKIEYLHEIIQITPLDKILIETDSPYLAPEPYRGRSNSPAFVYFICKKISEIKNIDIEEVAYQTTKNFHNLFDHFIDEE